MTTNLDRIRAYYSRFDEWQRLEAPDGALEFRRACALLRGRLPPASRVLDLGGGPGRYTIALAAEGHQVVLADLSPRLLQTARQKIAEAGVQSSVEAIDEINATDLGRYRDQSFDAVVAFGPFYHLTAEAERASAAAEIHRILRPEGLAFVAFLPRLSGIIGLIQRACITPEQVPVGALSKASTTGAFHNGTDTGFQEGYFPTPESFAALFDAANFDILEAVSLRSIASRLEAEVQRLDPQYAPEVDALLERLARDPAVVAVGGHAVLVVQARR